MNYQSLRQGRGIQNTLIADIANCLPPQSPVILSGDKAKMPPRAERQVIRIDKLAMDYHEEMTPFITLDEEQFRQQATVVGITVPQNAGGGGQIGRTGYGAFGGNPREGTTRAQSRQHADASRTRRCERRPATPAAAQRGFVVEVICTTPNAGGASYVLTAFVNKLKKLTSSDKDVNFKIDKVVVPSSMLLKNDPTLATQNTNLNTGYNPGRASGRPAACTAARRLSLPE